MSEFVPPHSLEIAPDRGAVLPGEPASASVAGPSRPLLWWMANPWVDKALAVLAVSPFVYPIMLHFQQHFRIGDLIYLAQVLILIGTMVVRRLPVRISTNPYYWVIAFLASYWGLLILSAEQPGRPIVTSPWILYTFYGLGVFMDVWGRLSLGRNIAMLPAQRRIVDGGAYRWVRHPIYTAVFLMILAGILGSFSMLNLALYGLGIVWCMARTLAEEEFLQKDPAYAAYMKRVPHRWLPGL